MTQTVTFSQNSISFSVDDNESILSAAKRQSLNLPHSCQNGICGQCKAQVVSGHAVQDGHAEQALTAEEQAAGKILMCCSTAQSDLVLDIPGFDADTPPVRTLPARVNSVEYIHDVAIVTLALPKAPPFAFYSGQYIDILLKNNHIRSYSIASSADNPGTLELHIRRRENGLFSNMLFGEDAVVKTGAVMRIRAPLGSFTLRKNSRAPLLLLATGTGFAPIKSILQYLAAHDQQREVHFYWGARHEADLYQADAAAELISRLPNGCFTQVLSRPQDGWQGKTGYIQQHILTDYPDLSAYEVYACGSPAMIEATHQQCETQQNLPRDSFFSDAFSPSH
ncbi:2Fe-2S iron-sulfur cluster-binding protein [Neisseria wadsworthii]|uniref:CDP-6-deoxy-delta-3,4-glucoseen reductase n=1 Tax=Neisseria wadsworthii 9715 TaxID=1030841 RepID=G4CSE4_9NEIS|nr:2Fe-2S iron-sulfur cluster-binding protein [Neisseria wadsworthii]EGZ44760.1 CDP-6-deoxy-delta-3,4-glucoseen reductase [Neisseria wadsworthii 9715]QMT35635.1 2Fe-2S iron-sulfur cluster binding domain-containing protein [Neisseria wadsworthii]